VTARPALFPEPTPDPPALSQALATAGWRLQPGEKAKWTRLSTKHIDCVECGWLQHEMRGNYGPRRQAKRRRTIGHNVRLDLCRSHAEAWQRRDAEDSKG
jgi:hypothetical protein